MSQVQLSFEVLIDGYDGDNSLNPLDTLLNSELPAAYNLHDDLLSSETIPEDTITTTNNSASNTQFSAEENDRTRGDEVENPANTTKDQICYSQENQQPRGNYIQNSRKNQKNPSQGNTNSEENDKYSGMISTTSQSFETNSKTLNQGNNTETENEHSADIFASVTSQKYSTQANKRARVNGNSIGRLTQSSIDSELFDYFMHDQNAPKRHKDSGCDAYGSLGMHSELTSSNHAGMDVNLCDQNAPKSYIDYGPPQSLIQTMSSRVACPYSAEPVPSSTGNSHEPNVGFINQGMLGTPTKVPCPKSAKFLSSSIGNSRESPITSGYVNQGMLGTPTKVPYPKNIEVHGGNSPQSTSTFEFIVNQEITAPSQSPNAISPMSSSGLSSISSEFAEGVARSNNVVFTSPLGAAPTYQDQNDGSNIELDFGISRDLTEQFGACAVPFQNGNLLSKPSHLLSTTGTPRHEITLSANNKRQHLNFATSLPQSSGNLTYQTPHTSLRPGPNLSQSLSAAGDPTLRSVNSYHRPQGTQHTGISFKQMEEISWNPVLDPVKSQEPRVPIPHIVIDSESSPYGIEALSPVSSTSTVHSNYRGPRSPKALYTTRASTANALCEVLNPKKEYDKIQKKFQQGPRRSEQRIQAGLVRLKIHTKHPLGAPPLRAFVKREPKAAYKLYQEHPDEYTVEDIPIPDVRLANEDPTDSNYSFCYQCELDLDSVYLTEDGKKEAYKLVRSKGAINNLFQLWFKLFFNNGVTETLMPYEFVLKSGRTPAQADCYADGGMRETIGPKSNVSCKYLQAERAKITNIHCQYIETNNHDIAYFMKVRCEDEQKPTDLEKGDVVAFLEDDEGDTYIDFLTSENANDARLAGVISRTAFFRGRKAICDPEHVDSDLVCIIGEVDVKVHGKVCAGDLIYTSNCILRRGTAVARNPKDPEIQPDDPDSARPTLLGMAMESYSDVDIKLVRCLVSIVLGISDLHQRQTLEELRQCSNKIVKMQKYLKGIWKKLFFFLFFLLVTGTLCYIFLAPNSPYLIMKCEEGCEKGNKGSCLYLKFDYYPHESQEHDEIVGINFKWKTIKKKLGLRFQKCPNGTDLHYYLNKNRCVTGNIRAISSWLDTTPQVPRVNVLAVNHKCSDIYYFSVREGWVAYDRNHFHINECEM